MLTLIFSVHVLTEQHVKYAIWAFKFLALQFKLLAFKSLHVDL